MYRHWSLALRIGLIAAASVAASAQNTTTIPVSISASGTGVVGGGSIPLTGTGTVSPYGSASANGSIALTSKSTASLSLTFALSTGDSFVATDPSGDVTQDTATAATVVGTATVSGGTGKFAGLTGSFAYTLDGSGSQGNAVKTWSLSGSGNFTTPAAPSPCTVQLSTSSLNLSALPGVLIPQAGVALQAVQTTPCTVAPVAFSASASTSDGQNWLSVTPASGTGTPPVALTVAANAAGLMPGIYLGTVQVTAGSTMLGLAVELTVSAAENLLNISQSGFQFQVAAGTISLPPQSVTISETGSAPLAYTASAQTLSGGSWLSVTPAVGTANPTATATVTVAVDSSGLAAGDYYGLVQFSAKGAGNSPQSAEVALRVLPATSTPEPLIMPTGLIFVESPSGATAPQTVQVFNPTNQPVTVTPTLTFQQGTGWITVSAGGTVDSGKTLALTLQVPLVNLSPGTYTATLNIQTSIDTSMHPVAIVLIVPATSTSSQAVLRREHPAVTGACTPTQLQPVFTLLGNSFQTPGGWPVALQTQVADNCGNPLTDGSVVATFSTGDPELAMVSIGGGQWAGTWQPHGTDGGTATITVNANSFMPALAGSAVISGTVSANPAVPSVDPGGVVSTASFQPNAPVAPGSFVSIFGSNLAPQLAGANALPYPPKLAGTEVVLGGQVLPLAFVANGQVNALVPYGVQVNAAQQLIVQQNNSYSLPQPVLVAATQPAVFTQNQSGMGEGVIVVLKANGTEFETAPSAPASAGDVLIVYCSGLGAVSPSVPAGMAASATTLSYTTNTVTATVGGQSAKVLFAGLAPDFAGLYQVNLVVPSGVTASTSVPVVLSVGGRSSVPVTVSIQ
ncbi:MAG TPA: hypothetical protein VK724_22790 [Bryobacteraceae bacterium]|nr:hypothetical protein [Bryobacteraceae bacterium]